MVLRGIVVTVEDRLAALETEVATLRQEMDRVRSFTDLMLRVTSADGRVPGIQINARIGVCTNYWMVKPFGQGATFSVGTAIDRFAAYVEIDEAVCPDHPSVALFAQVCGPNPHGQANHAVEAHAANAPASYALVADPMILLAQPDGVQHCWRREGMELRGGPPSFLMGTLQPMRVKALWP